MPGKEGFDVFAQYEPGPIWAWMITILEYTGQYHPITKPTNDRLKVSIREDPVAACPDSGASED